MQKCPYCNDTGLKDSGGETPWGDEILIPCICEAGDEVYEIQKLHLTPRAADGACAHPIEDEREVLGTKFCGVCGKVSPRR